MLAALFSTLSFSNAFAAKVACPKGWKTELSCKATPKAGDHEIAIGLFDQTVYCSRSGDYVMVSNAPGATKTETVAVVKDPARAGGSGGYSFDVQGVRFSFSQSVGRTGLTSGFHVYMADIDSSVAMKLPLICKSYIL